MMIQLAAKERTKKTDLHQKQHHNNPSQFALAFAGSSDYNINLEIFHKINHLKI